MNLNRVELLGNLKSDPTLEKTPSGSTKTSFFLITQDVQKDRKTGKIEKFSDSHWIVARGKLADVIVKYLKRGDRIYIDGRLRTREWKDGDEQWRCLSEIIASNLIMLGGKSRKAGSDQSNPDKV